MPSITPKDSFCAPMSTRFLSDLLWLLGLVLAAGLGWLLVRRGATPDSRIAIEAALRQARPADVESLTVYPLLMGRGAQGARPFQVRAVGPLRALLPALQQLRSVPVGRAAFQPLLEATLVLRLAAGSAPARHLHSRSIVFRLAAASQGEVVQLAQTNYFYQATELSRQLTQLRDSLPQR
ncbi:MAG: hypothetical protein EOO59_03585 [Hymenobacter sp.]|nr:MAG: hypothetical protein EOO59_03585 [Hymenobacter sp.]